MGLFSGFSIISGIELIVFVVNFLYRTVAHFTERLLNKNDDEDIKDKPKMALETTQTTDV